jgi:hypothetical protein
VSSGEKDRRTSILFHITLFRICTPIPTVDVGIEQAHTRIVKGLEHTRFIVQSTRTMKVSAFWYAPQSRALSVVHLGSCPIHGCWFTLDSNWPSYRSDRCSWTGPAYNVPFGPSLARMSSSTSDVPSRPHKMTSQSGVAPAMHSLCNQ